MPSLDSPVLTLGALFIAGNSSEGRNYTGGESGKGLIAGSFAASSSEYVAQQIRNQAGLEETAVSDELAQALVGAGLSRFGGPIPQSNAMARGILLNAGTQAIQDAGMSLGDIVDGGLGGGDDNGGSSMPSQVRQSQPTRNTGPNRRSSDAEVY